MKLEIRQITPTLFRACYDLGGGETTVPFPTENGAATFLRGFRHACEEMEALQQKLAREERKAAKQAPSTTTK